MCLWFDWDLGESGAGALSCRGTECSLRLEVPRDVICMASPSVWVFFFLQNLQFRRIKSGPDLRKD